MRCSRNLADARDDYHRKRRPVAFSLTATTGAGKTVMAAAVIESLFDGNDDFDFAADPGAVVLWFTDDPVAERADSIPAHGGRRPDRALAAGRDRATPSTRRSSSPGKVYFLNAQKLSKNSLLVKGARSDEAQDPLFERQASP